MPPVAIVQANQAKVKLEMAVSGLALWKGSSEGDVLLDALFPGDILWIMVVVFFQFFLVRSIGRLLCWQLWPPLPTEIGHG